MLRRLITLRLYYFACFAVLGAYLPYFPRWLEARGIEGLRMGMIAALSPALGVLGPPACGLLADALGLRGALLRSACLGAAMSFLAVAAAGALGHPLGFAGIFVAMLGFSLFRSPMSMMADVVALEVAPQAGTTYARIRLFGSIGFLASALAVGRWLDPRDAIVLPFVISAVLFLALLAAWALPSHTGRPTLPVTGQARALLAEPSFRLFLATSFLGQVAHSSYDLCFSLHLRDRGGASLTGVAWAIGVVAEVGLMATSGPLLQRVASPRLVAVATLGAAIRWALIASIGSVPLLLCLQPLHAISFSLAWVASLHYVKRHAPPLALATAQGLFSAATASGSVVGMLVWGALYRRAGGATTFAVAAWVSAAACVSALAWARRVRPDAHYWHKTTGAPDGGAPRSSP